MGIKTNRPEALIAEITDRLQKDVCRMIQHFRHDMLVEQKRPTDHDIEAEVVAMTVALAKGLKQLVHYSEVYAIKKHEAN